MLFRKVYRKIIRKYSNKLFQKYGKILLEFKKKINI